MKRRRMRHERENMIASAPLYERQSAFDAMLVLSVLVGILLSYLRNLVLVVDVLIFGGVLGGGFFAGHLFWGAIRSGLVKRRQWYMSQRSAAMLSVGIYLSSFVALFLDFSARIRSDWFFMLPLLQGFGAALGRQGPVVYRYYERRLMKEEVVELLVELAKKYRLDTSDDPAIFDELDRIVNSEVWVPSLRRVYDKDRIWIIQDLRERWLRQKRGEVTDIVSIWEKIVASRREVRNRLAATVGSTLIPERESLFPDLAKLPSYYSELVELLVRLAEYLDDFDRVFVHGLSPRKPEAGDRALALVLSKTGKNPESECVRTWFHLRELRNGVAHPSSWKTNKEFQEALQNFGITEAGLLDSPRVVWSKVSKAYLDSLDDLLRRLS